MLYAVIMRFDSLREISTSLQVEGRKLCHLSMMMMTSRSTLSDANKRRPEAVFEAIYRDLYATHHTRLSSDSRSGNNCFILPNVLNINISRCIKLPKRIYMPYLYQQKFFICEFLMRFPTCFSQTHCYTIC